MAQVQQDRFEEAVLTVVGMALQTDRRLDLVADDYLAEHQLHREDTDLRADLIICAADFVRLMAMPSSSHRVVEIFPKVEAAWRALPPEAQMPVDPRTSRIERTLRRFNSAFLLARST